MTNEKPATNFYDVIVVGAGISGINTAYYLQTKCPKVSYTILEGRKELGGTWSLFKYPGIRSDSDLYTFGFSWEPWNQPNAIAEADAIKDYLSSTAKKHHIDEKIQYDRFMDELNWSSDEERWTLSVNHRGERQTYKCKYIVLGTGYYDYKEPLEARIPGIEKFKGTIVHPQFWPEDLDYAEKKVIIIGSGATAVTLLPNLAKKAKMVTQVQRSPGHFLILPQNEPADKFILDKLPAFISGRLVRLRHTFLATLFYYFCQRFPNAATKLLRKGVKAHLPPGTDIDPHFKPNYNPWDQRMCITPGGDYFEAYKNGHADIKTGHIKSITEDGLIMESGEELTADIIITATGLKMQVGGGAQLKVDGKPVSIADKFMWRGTMVQDVPNLWYIIGYAHMSWTLAAETSGRLLARMINTMEAKGQQSVVPTLTSEQQAQFQKDSVPLLPLRSTYVNAAMEKRTIPRAGSFGNWQPKKNFFVDMFNAVFGNITNGLRYS